MQRNGVVKPFDFGFRLHWALRDRSLFQFEATTAA
jgi:hypothetical protein